MGSKVALPGKIQQLAEEYHSSVISLRRHIHANPELSFEEYETAKFVAAELTSIGVSFDAGIAGTGLVAWVDGKAAGETVCLRADLDALPILEQNTTEYVSKQAGVMHACGHDVHTASLLGAVRILQQTRDSWSGRVKFIFQPGEEKLPGGASMMIKEGVLKNPVPAHIIGQHVHPELASGTVGFRNGKYMASTDEIYITVKGKGGHGAMPHQVVDPVLIASHVVVALQQIVSRRQNPEKPSVLSFGKIIGNGATNVIPDEVRLEGTFRALDEDWRAEALLHIQTIAGGLVQSMGGKADIEVRKGYPCLVNHDGITNLAREAAQEYLGKDKVVELPIRMTAEDFAYYSHEVSSCFYRLGTRNEARGITAPVHNAHFDIDEDALKIGMGLMSYLAIKALGN